MIIIIIMTFIGWWGGRTKSWGEERWKREGKDESWIESLWIVWEVMNEYEEVMKGQVGVRERERTDIKKEGKCIVLYSS